MVQGVEAGVNDLHAKEQGDAELGQDEVFHLLRGELLAEPERQLRVVAKGGET